MNRTTSRTTLPLIGASAVLTALALTVGPFASEPAGAAPGAPGVAGAVPAESTPPSPHADGSGTTPPGPSTPATPDSPTEPSTGGTSQSSGTTGSGTSTGTETSSGTATSTATGTSTGADDGDGAASAVEQQKSDVDDVAADLQAKEDVPEDLAPSVERLSAVLRAVNEDSGTSPQVRDGALVSARQVSDTLDVIADPETPPAVRTQLTRLVKDVTATLEKAGDPRTPPDDRRTLASTSAQTAPGMAFVGRHAAPQGVSRDMTGAMHNAHAAVRQGADRRTAQTVLAATEAAGDPGTSDDDRKGLAESAHETSSSLVDGDPGTPSRKDGLEKKLKEALTARGLSGKPLGKAAEACTDRMFVIVSDTALADDLRDLVPDTWNTTGVEDYWKSTSAHDGSLDVYAQLQDDTPSRTTIATDRLIPELADVLPADDVFTLGIPALDCLQAALRLHDAGVESGNWVRAAQQI